MVTAFPALLLCYNKDPCSKKKETFLFLKTGVLPHTRKDPHLCNPYFQNVPNLHVVQGAPATVRVP